MFDRVRKINFRFLDEAEHSVLVSMEKWRDSHDHFIDEDAQRPPVNSMVVSASNKHFWRKILSRPTERIGNFTILLKLSEPKIRHFKISYPTKSKRDITYRRLLSKCFQASGLCTISFFHANATRQAQLEQRRTLPVLL